LARILFQASDCDPPRALTEAETEDLWHQSIEFTELVDKLSAQAPDATLYVVFDACRDELKLKQTGKSLGSNKGFVPITNTSEWWHRASRTGAHPSWQLRSDVLPRWA
jgi:hypothetical protein